MLLWVGAILCFVAYSIEVTTHDEVIGDNVTVYTLNGVPSYRFDFSII